MPVVVTTPPSGGFEGDPADPTQITEIEEYFAYIESSTGGNNTTSGGNLTETANNQAAEPDATSPIGYRPAYVAGQQNGKAVWRFASGVQHMIFDADSQMDNMFAGGGEWSVSFKTNLLGSSAFPRLLSQSDHIYLYLVAGPSGANGPYRLGFYCRFSSSDAWWLSTNEVITDATGHIVNLKWDSSTPTIAPEILVNGSLIQLSQEGSPAAGTIQSTVGVPVCVGNRTDNPNNADTFDRGFSGDIFDVILGDSVPSTADRKVALDERAADWDITVSNPFLPSIENQSFQVATGSANGTVVGTVVAQNNPDTFSLTGTAATYFSIDNDGVLTVSATLPASGVDVTGTVEVTTTGVGSDSATITVSVVAASALKYARPSWIASARVINATSNASGNRTYTPNSDGEDVAIYAPSGSSLSADSFRILEGGNGQFGNVAIIGGHYIGLDDAGSGDDAVWVIRDMEGDLWMEGVRLTCGDRQDGVQFGGKSDAQKGDFYFQRIYCEHIVGPRSSPHGDMIQSRGPVNSVFVDMFYGETGYQFFFLDGIQSDQNAGAYIDGEVVITNGDVVRVDNESYGGFPYGGPNSSGGGTDATGGYIFWMDNYPSGFRVGSTSGASVDSVWVQKYSGIYVGTESPTTPPNRFFWYNGGPFGTYNGSTLLTLGGSRGFVNVGDRPGGPLLTDQGVSSKFYRNGQLYGGAGYTG